MSQRMKARAMMSANGHGSELKHVSTRVVGAAPSAMSFPNQAIDSGGAPAPAPAPMPDPAAAPAPAGLKRGGRT